MTFNEFSRCLHDCQMDQAAKHLMLHMFEVQVHLSKELDMATNLIARMADTLQGFVQLSEDTRARLARLQAEKTPGVEVKSEPWESN